METSLRQTGRTSRMLAQAAGCKADGEPVLIVIYDDRSIRSFLRYPEARGLERSDFISVGALRHGGRGRRARVFIDNCVTDVLEPDAMLEVYSVTQPINEAWRPCTSS